MRLTSFSRNLMAARYLEGSRQQASAAGERLSSGLRINRAADAPSALPRGIRFATQALSTRMALQNIGQGRALLTVAESALGQASDLLLRARDLALSAAHGTLSDSDRTNLQTELNLIRDEVGNLFSLARFGGAQIFGAFGRGFAPLFTESFGTAGGIAGLNNTAWSSGRVRLAQASQSLFTDTFAGTASVDGGLTTAMVDTAAGRVVAPQAMATAVLDSFSTLGGVDSGLTTALVDTVSGLVRLARAAQQRASDLFDSALGTNGALTTAVLNTAAGYVTQGFSTQSVLSDTFANTLTVNGGLTTAVVDTGAGLVRLPGGAPTWSAALSDSPGWRLGRVFNARLSDSFAGTAGTDPISTALISGGLARSAAVTTALFGASPGFRLPGTASAWGPIGADSFADTSRVLSSTGLQIDTLAGVVRLLTETFSVGTDSFTSLANVDTGLTTALVDTALGTVSLPTTAVTAGDTFGDLTRILGLSAIAVDTAAGTAALSRGAVTLDTESFGDSTGVGSASTGVRVSGGQLELEAVAQLNNKYATTAVFNPGIGAGSVFDSRGVLSTSVLDLGGGTLRMYYVTARNNGSNPTVGYTTSTNGGATWSTGTNLSLSTGISLTSEVAVVRDSDTGTYYMFHSGGGNNIYRRSSADGITWSGVATVLNRGTYSSIGRPTITRDSGGTYHMFYEVAGSQIEHATASSLGGPWTDLAGWTNIAGTGPQVVQEADKYSLYYNSGGAIVRRTSTDLKTWTTAASAITTGTGFDANAVKTGGAVYDSGTGTTRMLYLGRSSATGEWSAGLAYTTARTTGTFISTVTNTADTVQNLTLAATANTASGTVTYRVSADGGTTWQAIAAGGSIAVAAGKQLLLEAVLTNTGGVNSAGPSLQDYTLSADLYAASGTLTSTAYTFASPITSFTLSAAATAPATTSIAYEFSVDGATWASAAAGSTVTLGSAASQLQIRALLSTTDRGYTPTLADYSISYSQPTATGYLYTKNYTFTDSISAFDLTATETGSVAWEYSADSGTTWQSAALGTNGLAGPVNQLKLRARLDSGATAPTISDYAISAIRFQSGGTLISTEYSFATPVTEVRLTAAESTPGGSAIGYQISTDGGATWQAIANGGSVTLGAPATSVRLRADLSRTDGYYTPTLSDYTLEGLSSGYAATATYTSPLATFGYNVRNITLNVTENKPAGTDITYELSADGGSTWQSVTPGANLGVTPGSNLLLRANLSTTDPAVTPELVGYSVTSEQLQSGSVWQSVVSSLTADATAVRLTTVENLVAGTAIAYEVSGDGGATWTAVAPGVSIALTGPGSQLAVRAIFTSTDPYDTAELLDLVLEADDQYAAGTTFASAYQTLAAATTQVRLDSVSVSTPAGTGVTYEVTNDGGATWQSVSPGGTAAFGTAGTQVGLRATLAGDGTATPEVTSVVLSVPDTAATYAAEAYLYSTVTSLGSDLTNVTLTANASEPAGTSIQYEVSTDGGATWTAVTNGVNTAVTAGRDLAVRARLSTADAALTPELLDYTLEAVLPAAGQEWYSTAVATGADVGRVRLSVTENKPAGTEISYAVSTDGGATFQAITAGSFTAVTPGSSLVLKASFSSTGGQVAQLLDYTLETEDYASPRQLRTQVNDIGHDITELLLNVTANQPGGTGIAYELSNDGGATWQAATPGVLTTFGAGGSQIALRATLTGTNLQTPELLDYSISAPMYTDAVLYSTAQNLASPATNLTLSVTDTAPAGTSIQYALSTDGGASWLAVTPGSNLALGAPASQVVLQATLSSSNGRRTPELFDWSVDSLFFNTSGDLLSEPISLPLMTDTVRLFASQDLTYGSIAYEISHDGGTTWTPATIGVDTRFPQATREVLLRASFTTPNDAYSPELLKYWLEGLTDRARVDARFSIQASLSSGDQIPITLPWVTPDSLGISELEIASAAEAASALPALDQALRSLSEMRSQVSAAMAAFAFQEQHQAGYGENLTRAVGNVMDADMAKEAVGFLRAQIMSSSGSSVLAAHVGSSRSAVAALLAPLPSARIRPPEPRERGGDGPELPGSKAKGRAQGLSLPGTGRDDRDGGLVLPGTRPDRSGPGFGGSGPSRLGTGPGAGSGSGGAGSRGGQSPAFGFGGLDARI